MAEQPVVALGEAEPLLLGESLDFRRHRAGGAGNETNDVAIFGRLDQRLAPPAKPDNARFDHLPLPPNFYARFFRSCFDQSLFGPILIWASPHFGRSLIWANSLFGPSQHRQRDAAQHPEHAILDAADH